SASSAAPSTSNNHLLQPDGNVDVAALWSAQEQAEQGVTPEKVKLHPDTANVLDRGLKVRITYRECTSEVSMSTDHSHFLDVIFEDHEGAPRLCEAFK
ncbi:hypothetical protein OC834_007827, partial [Tilletia horrida]